MVYILGARNELRQKALIMFVSHLFLTRPISESKLPVAIGTPSFQNDVILTSEIFTPVEGKKKYVQVVSHPTNIGEGYTEALMMADAWSFMKQAKESVARIMELYDADVAKQCMRTIV